MHVFPVSIIYIAMKKRANIIVSGKVRGVFFRVYAKQKAEELGLTGWVKNSLNGQVEIVAEGEEKNLKDLVKWCYNGPSGAEVKKVEVKWNEFEGRLDKFEILA